MPANTKVVKIALSIYKNHKIKSPKTIKKTVFSLITISFPDYTLTTCALIVIHLYQKEASRKGNFFFKPKKLFLPYCFFKCLSRCKSRRFSGGNCNFFAGLWI